MKLVAKLSLLLLAFMLFTESCSVQKRRYIKGYYIKKHSAVNRVKQNENVSLKTIKPAFERTSDNTYPVIKYLLASSVKTAMQDPLLLVKPTKKLPVNGGCDTVFFRNGDVMLAKVLEISSSEIRYKRCDNLEGPTIVSSSNDILSISYVNGSKDIINKPASPPESFKTYKTHPESQPTSKYSKEKVTNQNALIGFISSMMAILFVFLSLGLLIVSASAGAISPYLVYVAALIPILALFGLIKSIIGLKQIRRNSDVLTGKHLAIMGLIWGAIVLGICLIIALVALLIYLAI